MSTKVTERNATGYHSLLTTAVKLCGRTTKYTWTK